MPTSSIPGPSQIYPDWDFLLENMPSGIPGLFSLSVSGPIPPELFSSVCALVSQSRVSTPFSVSTWARQHAPGLPDLSWYNIPKREKYTQLPQSIPNARKIYLMAVK
jgi:hypothetical protein